MNIAVDIYLFAWFIAFEEFWAMLLKILDLFYIFFYILKVYVLKFLVFVQKTCILEVFKN